jgi:hypothetical protein
VSKRLVTLYVNGKSKNDFRVSDVVDSASGIVNSKETQPSPSKVGQGAEINVNPKAKTMAISLKNMNPARLAGVKNGI